jgi:hypothetical protein
MLLRLESRASFIAQGFYTSTLLHHWGKKASGGAQSRWRQEVTQRHRGMLGTGLLPWLARLHSLYRPPAQGWASPQWTAPSPSTSNSKRIKETINVLVRVSIAVMKHNDQRGSWGGEGLYGLYFSARFHTNVCSMWQARGRPPFQFPRWTNGCPHQTPVRTPGGGGGGGRPRWAGTDGTRLSGANRGSFGAAWAGLEAFSHNPTDGSFAPLAPQPSTYTKCLKHCSPWLRKAKTGTETQQEPGVRSWCRRCGECCLLVPSDCFLIEPRTSSQVVADELVSNWDKTSHYKHNAPRHPHRLACWRQFLKWGSLFLHVPSLH